MIKHVFCCLLLNFICLNVNAQITDWSWIRLVSGVKGITTIELKLDADVAVDSKNNIISIGAFTGTVTFGETVLVSRGQYDIFMAKSDSNGQWLWVEQAGGTSGDFGRAVAVDNTDNIYFTGSFVKSATFGDTTLNAEGYDFEDSFLAKYSPDGNLMWVKQISGTFEQETDIACNEEGKVFLTGDFGGSISFDQIILESRARREVFIAECDESGIWRLAVRAGGINNWHDAYSSAIAIDADGNYNITGYFWGELEIGNSTLTSTDEDADIFIARCNPNGNWLAGYQAYGEYGEWATGLILDDTGNIIVTGIFDGSIVFGDISLNTTWDTNLFLARCNSEGFWEMATQSKGNSSADPEKITADQYGNITVTGSFYFDSCAFGDTVLTSNGLADIFVAQCDKNGNWLWAINAGGENNDNGNSIAVDHNNNVIVVGSFEKNAQFGDTIFHSKNTDVFIGKLKNTTNTPEEHTRPKSIVLFNNFPNPFNSGTTISYSIPASEYVTLEIYDILGKRLRTLVNENQTADTYFVNFSAANLSSGIYFYQLRTGSDFIETKKMLLIK